MVGILNRLSISKKVVGFITILLSIMLGISIYSFYKTKTVNDEIVDEDEWMVPLTDSLGLIESHSLDQEVQVQRLFRLYERKSIDKESLNKELSSFKERQGLIKKEFVKSEQLIPQALKKMKRIDDVVFVSKLSPLFKTVDEQHQQYYEHAQKILETLEQGKLDTARVLEDQLDAEQIKLNKMISNLYEQLVQFDKQQNQKLLKHEAGIVGLSIENVVISLLAFILGIVVTTILTKRIVKPVYQIISGAKAIAQGKLDVKVPVFSKDEIGMLATSFNLMVQELKTKELIKEKFGQYVDPRVVDTLLKQDESGLNNGEKQVMTVFFSDLEGYSSITEVLTPLRLVNLINKYLTLASEPIIRYKGVIDKYIGDAIMSFWGPPFTDESEHAKLACLASLEQFVKLDELQAQLPDLLGFRKGLPKINVRIGLCTGELIVGNIGSNISKSYTVMGDTVNVASRLESVNKQYGTHILMSEATYELVKDEFESREIDNIIVVGKSEPVRIFELLGIRGKLENQVLELRDYFQQGLSAYRARNWDEAQKSFETCLEINSSDGPSKVFVDRVKVLRENPPSEDWNGVWQMTKK